MESPLRRLAVRRVVIKGQTRGWSAGRTRETAVWLATARRRRFLWRNHDALYVACGRFRLRVIKPWERWPGMAARLEKRRQESR